MGSRALSRRIGRRHLRLVRQVVARQGEDLQQPVDGDPGGHRVVVGQLELVFLAGHGEALDQPDAAVDARQAAAAVLDPPPNDLEAEARLPADVHARGSPRSRSAPRVSMLWSIRYFSCGRSAQQPGEHAVAQQVGRPRTSAPSGAGIAAAGCRCNRCRRRRPRPRPISAACRLSRTFCGLHVEDLLRHFLPGEAEVAGHGDHAQSDGAARRQGQRPRVPVVLAARRGNVGSVRGSGSWWR